MRAAELRVEHDAFNAAAREQRSKWQWYFLMGAVGYLKGELPPGTEGGGGNAEAAGGGLQRVAEDKPAGRARWEMVRKLLTPTLTLTLTLTLT